MTKCDGCGRPDGYDPSSVELPASAVCWGENDTSHWRARAEALQVERDAAVALVAKIREAVTFEPTGVEDEYLCAACDTSVIVDPDCEWDDGDVCHGCAQGALSEVQVLTRIDKGAE